MSRLFLTTFSVLLLGAFFRGAVNAQADANNQDSLRSVVQAYDTESRTRRFATDSERLDFYQKWYDRIQESSLENPDSSFLELALIKMVGLANGLQDHTASKASLMRLLDTSSSPEFQLRWRSELAEVLLNEFYDKRDTESLQSDMPEVETIPAIASRLESEGKLDSQLRGKYIQGLHSLATVIRNGQEDYLEAAKVSELAFEQYENLDEADKLKFTALGFNPEYYLSLLLKDYSRGSDLDRALDILSRLKMLCDTDPDCKPPSHYALVLADSAYGSNPLEYQKFLSNWLKNENEDAETAFLIFYLARSYFQSESYSLSYPYYIRLHKEFKSVLLDRDKRAVERGSGGYYAEVLFNLAHVCHLLGKQLEFEKILSEAKEIFFRDPRLTGLSQSISPQKSSRPLDSPGQNQSDGHVGHWVSILLINLVAVFVCVLIWKWWGRTYCLGSRQDALDELKH